MSEDEEKIEIDIENKYIRNKEKTKFTMAECFHILKSQYYCDEVEDIAINCLEEFYTLNDNKWETKIKDKIKELVRQEDYYREKGEIDEYYAKIEVLEDILKENNI